LYATNILKTADSLDFDGVEIEISSKFCVRTLNRWGDQGCRAIEINRVQGILYDIRTSDDIHGIGRIPASVVVFISGASLTPESLTALDHNKNVVGVVAFDSAFPTEKISYYRTRGATGGSSSTGTHTGERRRWNTSSDDIIKKSLR
jgi:hypothetical protein